MTGVAKDEAKLLDVHLVANQQALLEKVVDEVVAMLKDSNGYVRMAAVKLVCERPPAEGGGGGKSLAGCGMGWIAAI